MRKRLALLSLAITSIVVIAFLVPLGILVKNQAQNRALTRAERFSQSIAAGLGVASSVGGAPGVDQALAMDMLDAFSNPPGTSVVFANGVIVGEPFDPSFNLDQAMAGAALTAAIPGGAEVLVPLVSTDPRSGGTVVVRSFVSNDEMSEGVATAWVMLIALGVFLTAIAVAAADRLGRSIVKPVTELSAAARRMGEGDLRTRVEPEGPEEIAEVGEAFNFLAHRLEELLEAERESVADLSHRLRTPLTALRLQVETATSREDLVNLLADVERMEAAVNVMIVEARSPSPGPDESAEADLGAVVDHRAAFWQVLADEQGRATSVLTEPGDHLVPVSADDLGALVDVLIGNVFTHTDEGVGYLIRVRTIDDGHCELIVEDAGRGFIASGALRRGHSSSGSTGLGLDIVARTAERSGGTVRLGESDNGGARVEVVFGRPQQAGATEQRRVATSPGV
ncbi:MAG: HAMP domain-containing sensor histidine kinase [Acidimicrobiia bacterium]|nr:MAG: HAMP domain-containing sensor histidine kinase [Acidimicrobiia bacterium]